MALQSWTKTVSVRWLQLPNMRPAYTRVGATFQKSWRRFIKSMVACFLVGVHLSAYLIVIVYVIMIGVQNIK